MAENIGDIRNIDWKKMGFLFLGLALFAVVYWSPIWPDAVDPMGKNFPLSHEAKGAIAVFLLAATWWVFEVVPIGVTSLAIGVLQAMFLIRPARDGLYGFYGPLGHVYLCLDYDRAGIHQDGVNQTPGIQDAGYRR